MKAKAAVLALLVGPLIAWPQAASPLERWSDSHPTAAAELRQWVAQYPVAARRLFLWDRDHPGRSHFFWTSLTENPDETFDDFVQARPHWPAINLVLRPHKPAVLALIQWVHRHPAAVSELAVMPRGFAWLGFHICSDLWNAPSSEPDWNAPSPGEAQRQ